MHTLLLHNLNHPLHFPFPSDGLDCGVLCNHLFKRVFANAINSCSWADKTMTK